MVKVSFKAGVAVVRLARAEKHNALNLEMFEGIRDAQRRVRREGGVRAVVLAGEGPSFCSGLDIDAMQAGTLEIETLLRRRDGALSNLAQTASHGWRTLPVPVIAAIHGACFGGGLQIALGADIRIAAPDAKLSVMEIRLGLVPDMGITVALPQLVRADIAKELTFTGRIVYGEEAAELGLVTRVAESEREAAIELASQIAGRSPDAIRAIKGLYDATRQTTSEVSLRTETEHVRTLFGSPNQLEATRAAIAGERPSFVDPPPEVLL